MLLNCGVGKESWECLGLQGDHTSQSQRKLVLNILWNAWCWSWSSNTLATWCEDLIHWERPWFWERLKGGEVGDRGWDVWMASPARWPWIWGSSRGWTGKPGVLQSTSCKKFEMTLWLNNRPFLQIELCACYHVQSKSYHGYFTEEKTETLKGYVLYTRSPIPRPTLV